MKLKLKEGMRRHKKYKKLGLSLPEICHLLRKEFNSTKTKLFGKNIEINSAFWYLHGLEELFIDETYKFEPTSISPRIIDCGANIGLSVIYFKRLFPESKITAFEPDKDIFTLLQKNLEIFGCNDIDLINKAVWKENRSIKFLASGGVGGRIQEAKEGEAIFELPAVRLKDYLNEEIDFLKIDIEGSELDVINDCRNELKNVKNIFIEYHSEESREQKLDEILRILKSAGFKYYIKEAWNNQPNPFINKRVNLFDLQLNIFGYRLEA